MKSRIYNSLRILERFFKDYCGVSPNFFNIRYESRCWDLIFKTYDEKYDNEIVCPDLCLNNITLS